MQILKKWSVSQSVSCQKFAFREFCWAGGWGVCLFVSVQRSLQILSLSLSLVLLYAVWTSNNKWLLIVDGEFFLFLSCQHPGNFVPTDHPNRQKTFWNGLCHSLSVDLSNASWAQTGLINKAATPHKAPIIRPPASHHENYPS